MKSFRSFLISESFYASGKVSRTKDKDDYVEIFKNPDGTELAALQEEGEYGECRAFIDTEGNLYAWNPDFVHHVILKKFKLGGVSEYMDLSNEHYAKGFGAYIYKNGNEVSPLFNTSYNNEENKLKAKNVRKHFELCKMKNPILYLNPEAFEGYE